MSLGLKFLLNYPWTLLKPHRQYGSIGSADAHDLHPNRTHEIGTRRSANLPRLETISPISPFDHFGQKASAINLGSKGSGMLPTSNSFFCVDSMDSMVHQTSSKSTSIFGKPFQFDGWKFFVKTRLSQVLGMEKPRLGGGEGRGSRAWNLVDFSIWM